VELTRRDNGWWIQGADPYYVDGAGPFVDYGPYDNKGQAADDLRGLQAFEELFLIECEKGKQGGPSAGQLEAIPANASDTELMPCSA
jgi:hypothetical protein